MTSGYSGTPLIKKLGIKAGMKICILNAPANYAVTLGDLPDGVIQLEKPERPLYFIHFFTTERTTLEREFPPLKNALAQNGMLWISWPKRTAPASIRLATDLDENTIREIGLANGLVDVKVAAVDEVWSALKFVYRVKDRK